MEERERVCERGERNREKERKKRERPEERGGAPRVKAVRRRTESREARSVARPGGG